MLVLLVERLAAALERLHFRLEARVLRAARPELSLERRQLCLLTHTETHQYNPIQYNTIQHRAIVDPIR